MKKAIKISLVGLTIAFLVTPALFWLFAVEVPGKLNGYFEKTNPKSFSTQTWFTGAFQKNAEPYVSENIPGRVPLIRMANQFQFSLLNYQNSSHIVEGTNGVLYETPYLDAYVGLDFLGRDSIETLSKKLRFIQDELAKQNTHLFFVLAPGKASYFPDNFPSYYANISFNPDSTNYSQVVSSFQKQGVHFLDFQKWFNELKGTTPFLLYPNTGIHWSYFGSYLAGDSILNYINSETNSAFPSMVLDTIYQPDTVWQKDQDIELGLNLMLDLPDWPMVYPSFHFEPGKDPGASGLVIGDSYYWNLHLFHFSKSGLNHGTFLYYYSNAFNDTLSEMQSEEKWKMDAENLVSGHRVVMILSSECNLKKLGHGFIDHYYKLVSTEKGLEKRKQQWIKLCISRIKNDAGWNQKVLLAAEKNNISYQEALLKNAQYAYYVKFEKEKR